MKKHLLIFLLAIALICSVLSITAIADENTYSFIIDLTGYNGTIEGVISQRNTPDIELVPGQKNILDASNLFYESTITLNDLLVDSDIMKSWSIEGVDEAYIDTSTGTISLYINGFLGMKITRVMINENQIKIEDTFGFSEFDSWGTNSITIRPHLSSVGNFEISVESNDSSRGSTSSVATSNLNEYVITATPNDGYSFAYWLKEGLEDTAENRILVNPATVTLMQDSTYVAYFRERYSIEVLSSDSSQGTASFEYAGVSEGQDQYCLTASPATYYAFDRWSCGETNYTENPLAVSVGESGWSYTASFKPVELIVSDEAVLIKRDSVTDGFYMGNQGSYGGILSAGCRSVLSIPVTIPADLPGAEIQVTVTDANGQVLNSFSDIRDLVAADTFFEITFDPTAADVSNLTAMVVLTTPAGSSTDIKTYTSLSVAASENNNSFRFVSSPSDGYSYSTVRQAGANLNGVYARTDETTKALSLYGYGPGGVCIWNKGGVSVTRLTGLPTGDGKEVKALGPAGENGLTAVVGDTTITLYTWDGESWTAVENTSITQDSSQQGTKVALVMASDDVWTDTRHWNGTTWENQSYGFTSFELVSDTEAYGIDGSGQRWRYDGSGWTEAETVYTPDISSATSLSVDGISIGIGQDQHGDWYLFIKARSHFIDDSNFYGYNGSDVYKWNGSRWVYQIMSDFNDPNDDPMEVRQRIRPDGVNAISVPAPGISVMYGTRARGGNGAIYLSTDNVTITFNPGEGTLDDTAMGTMTAPILSEIDSSKVPGASREGFTFNGWYYDEACTIEFDPSNTAMPGESITLYAKYSDGSDPEAQLTWYKQKALKDLEKQYKKYSSADYTSENWSALQSAYIDGISAINNATAGTAHIEENVTAALNAAIAAMQAIPPKDTSKVTVAVSMDANTLGLGYILEPTLVTVDKGTPVSVVITDLLSQQAQTKYGITEPGKTTKVDGETISTLYPWISDDAPTAGFYLSQVYYPDQTGYSIPATIQDYITGNQLAFVAADANGKYLGEFDYLNTSGWTYSVGDKTNGATEFPGIGSNGWGLSDGEVVRWQFTLVGYGADLGADNTAWGTNNILSVGDKSTLTWKVAELRNQYSDATLKAEIVYTDALTVLTDAEATQSAIDAALEALNGLTIVAPGEVPDEKIDITGEDTESPIADVTSEISANGTATLHVTAENPCMVIVKKADGTYERLEAVKNGSAYDFSIANYSEDMEFFVLLKGDVDGDGKITGLDATIAKSAFLGKEKLDELGTFAADLDGNGFNGSDATSIKSAFLGKEKLEW